MGVLRGSLPSRVASPLALCALSAIGARISIIRSFPDSGIGLLSLPLGLMLGWLLRSRPSRWPLLLLAGWVGIVIGHLGHPDSVADITRLFALDAAQVLLSAWVVLKWAGRPAPDMRGTVALVAGGAFASSFVFAFVKALMQGAAVARGTGAGASFAVDWWSFLASDVLSILSVTPLLVYVSAPDGWWTGAGARRVWEATALAIGMACVATVALMPGFHHLSRFVTVAAAPLPFVLWAAMRFGPAGVASAVLSLTLLAMYGATGAASFVVGSPAENVLAMETFLAILASSMLLLSAALVERQKAVSAVHASETRYKSVVEAQSEMVCRYLPDTRLTFVNEAYCRFFGRTPEELLGQRWIELVPASERDRVEDAVARLCAERKAITQTHRVLQPNGMIGWTQWTDVVVANEQGQVELQGIGRDVTFLTLTNEALRRSEERLKRAMEAGSLGDWEVDLETGHVWWSASLAAISGRAAADFPNIAAAIKEVVHEADRAGLEAQLAAIADGRAHRIHFRVTRPDGEVRWVEGGGDAVPDEHGRPRWLVGIASDVTQRKHDEDALRRALEEVRRLKDSLQAENAVLLEELSVPGHFGDLVYTSDPMKAVLARAERVAPGDTVVLITGETGTGKELMARAIHERSPRKARPLVRVNCAALPAALIESELFGHEKGAFTGAVMRRAGRFEIADRGTLFLDEIGELSLELQSKLLRVLQDGEFQRLGSSKTITTDVRLIAATNRDLEAAVREGRFRSDLYYRLNVFPIHMPSLRERPEDISPIAAHFLDRIGRSLGRGFEGIGAATLSALERYRWPGNVRELQNVLERAAVLSEGRVLTLPEGWDASLPKRPATTADTASLLEELTGGNDEMTLEALERAYILQVLARTRWRIEGPRGAALILGMNPSTLRSRLTKLGIAAH